MRDFTWKISLISVSNKGKLFVRVICRETFHNCSPKLKKLFLTTCIIWKENWKISFYQESQLFENGICISNICAKNADISKIMKTWEIISIFFHKLSRLYYNCTKFHVSSMFLSRDIVRGQKWPALVYKDTKWPRPNSFKTVLMFLRDLGYYIANF